jgi:hypothetical protein
MTLQAQRTVTTLGGILVSLLLSLAGSGLLFWGTALPAEQEFWRELLKSFGSIVVSIGVLAFMWELFTKRSFLEETLALANMAVELKNAGIERVSNRYLSELQWAEMLKTSQSLGFFFAYARTWCNVNTVSLGEAARLKGRTLRVLLPDPDNPQVVNELARRFNSATQDVENAIKETKTFFEKLGRRPGEGTVVEIRYVAATPLFSIYLLGERAVFSLHSHRNKAGYVPTCVVKREGSIFRYLEEEFGSLWQSGTVVFRSRDAKATGEPAPGN